jgi:hypothetical protein
MAEEAWGLPIRDPDLHNLSDAQFLVRVLGPKHMGYQVMQGPGADSGRLLLFKHCSYFWINIPS